MGISYYYESLPHGEREKFLMEAAVAIGQSISNVRKKVKKDGWSKLERPVIEEIIEKRKLS